MEGKWRISFLLWLSASESAIELVWVLAFTWVNILSSLRNHFEQAMAIPMFEKSEFSF